ncbi:transcription factor bHLH47 isoform X2 [Amborella trichopoda]|uniref:transcription factor bHLH47 isoform X2 n=1 Tax=Amborella trichopoda TaxID=13333 RepID=UPI0005D38EBD|nr:transcription factor bHLH47 isoform X2 [Amborella trichopoda]XP_020519037.1 transcription factor bHLH47 isoform X2 [Amborella trichopoda]|eukprot:XP_011622069.1 transcription factor bHLH47 isoform X2 [Amborella trichopoda]
MATESNVNNENLGERSSTFKKSMGRVSRKVHKAEREKLKRNQFNELFLELGQALEPDRQNNGKASILIDATRVLRDLFAHVEFLKTENAALLTESRYIAEEKNELRDEKLVLEAEIEKLQSELQQKIESNALRDPPPHNAHSHDANSVPTPLSVEHVPPHVVGPVLVIPLHPDPHLESDSGFNGGGASVSVRNSQPNVSVSNSESRLNLRRPHPRYPTPDDSWAEELLKQPRNLQVDSADSVGVASVYNAGFD